MIKKILSQRGLIASVGQDIRDVGGESRSIERIWASRSQKIWIREKGERKCQNHTEKKRRKEAAEPTTGEREKSSRTMTLGVGMTREKRASNKEAGNDEENLDSNESAREKIWKKVIDDDQNDGEKF